MTAAFWPRLKFWLWVSLVASLGCWIVHIWCLHRGFGSYCQSSDVNALVTLTAKWLFGSAEPNTTAIITNQHRHTTIISRVVTLLTGVNNENDNEVAGIINMRNITLWWRVNNWRESKGWCPFVYVNHNGLPQCRRWNGWIPTNLFNWNQWKTDAAARDSDVVTVMIVVMAAMMTTCHKLFRAHFWADPHWLDIQPDLIQPLNRKWIFHNEIPLN